MTIDIDLGQASLSASLLRIIRLDENSLTLLEGIEIVILPFILILTGNMKAGR